MKNILFILAVMALSCSSTFEPVATKVEPSLSYCKIIKYGHWFIDFIPNNFCERALIDNFTNIDLQGIPTVTRARFSTSYTQQRILETFHLNASFVRHGVDITHDLIRTCGKQTGWVQADGNRTQQRTGIQIATGQIIWSSRATPTQAYLINFQRLTDDCLGLLSEIIGDIRFQCPYSSYPNQLVCKGPIPNIFIKANLERISWGATG